MWTENTSDHADEIRKLLAKLRLSQSEAARVLEWSNREFRGFCQGHPCPMAVVMALKYLEVQESYVQRNPRQRDRT